MVDQHIRSRPRAVTIRLLAGLLTASAGLLPLAGCENGQRDMRTSSRTQADDTRRDEVATAGWVVARPGQQMDGPVAVRMPGPTGADALLVRRDQPGEVRAGEPLRYTIEVENVSNMMMRDIEVHEWRTGEFEIDRVRVNGSEVSRSGDGEGAGDGRQWSIDALEPGQRELIEVVGVAPEEGSVATCMTITYEPALCMVTDVVSPDLVLRRAFADERAFVCDPIEVTYVVENSGSAVARDVTVVEELPEGLTGPGGARTVRFTVPSIQPGASIERQMVLRADAPGQYTTSASVTSDAVEARSREQTVTFVRPSLELSVDAPEEEYVGRSVPIRMTIRNTGDAPALDTVIRVPGLDQLMRATLSTRQADMSGNEIRLGRIDAGQERDLTLVFDADSPQTRDMEFTAEAYCAESVSDALAIEVIGVPAIRLETIDLVDPVVVGDETTYEIRVKNQGSAVADDVTVTARIPDEMTFVEGVGDSGVNRTGRTVRLAPIDALAPGEIASWRLTVRADSPGRVQFQLELSSAATTTPARESEPTTIIEAAPEVRGTDG